VHDLVCGMTAPVDMRHTSMGAFLDRGEANRVALRDARRSDRDGGSAGASGHCQTSPDAGVRHPDLHRRVVSIPGVDARCCFTAIVPRDDRATTLAACTGCGASWRGTVRAPLPSASRHRRRRHPGRRSPGHRGVCACCLDLVAVGGVWCRLLARQQTAVSPVRDPKQDHLS
jgi:hypothetical protein